MKTIKQFLLCSLLMAIGVHACAQTFTLKSNDLEGQFTQQYISGAFGCTGQNLSPQLSWVNPPSGTQSYALTMYDPDAPTGSGWWHWVVYNIPPNVNELKRGAGKVSNQLIPQGAVQALTDFGTPGYGGPCPPENGKPHAYIITIFALKTPTLKLDKQASAALVGFLINQNIIAKASLIVYSKR